MCPQRDWCPLNAMSMADCWVTLLAVTSELRISVGDGGQVQALAPSRSIFLLPRYILRTWLICVDTYHAASFVRVHLSYLKQGTLIHNPISFGGSAHLKPQQSYRQIYLCERYVCTKPTPRYKLKTRSSSRPA